MANIVAVVSMKAESVGGGLPIFVVPEREEQERIAFLLEKIMDAAAHDLKNGTIILVNRH